MSTEKIKLSKKQREAVENGRIAREQHARYVRARDHGHAEYVKMADRCDNFYVGEQWSDADVAKLDQEKRPHLTINMVLATVNAVIGEQASKRVEFKFKPSVGGREDSAMAHSKLSQVIKDANRYDYVESQVFQDGVIAHGRGFFDIRMGFDTNIRGDVIIRSDDPRSIILDPDAKEYDPSTWNEIFETSWLSLDEIEALYGRAKAEEVRSLGINGTRFDPDTIMWDGETFGDARAHDAIGGADAGGEDSEKTIRKVRVIERQHIRRVPLLRFVDPQTGDSKNVPPDWDEKRATAFAQQQQLFLVRAVDKKVRWTVTADNVVLHDDWSPYKTFTKIPYFCYFRRGRPFGLVTNLLSPQEQLNKLSSQELHIVNTTANSGWVVEEGALSGMTPDDLRNQGAETGLVLTVARGRKDGLEKIQPNSVPSGLDRLSAKSAGFIREISGVNDALMGTQSPEVSGVVLKENVAAGLVQLQVPFDNLDLTRFMVANKILELVQQFYTEERVFTLVTDDLNFEDPSEQEFIVNMKTASGEVINDLTAGKYTVSMSLQPARDSFMDQQFAEAVNLRNIGVMIPDDRIIEYSHLARKDKLAQEVRDITGRGEITEEQAAQLQFEQRIQQGLMMAELARSEAEVMVMEAEMMKLAAEASQLAGGAESPAMIQRRNELLVELEIAKENAQLRRDLAQLSATSRLDQTVLSTQGKVLTTTVGKREDRKTKLLSEAKKPTASPQRSD